MKVAIVHDWLVTNAGAEKVLEEILACYPHADIFSLVDFLDEQERREILQGKKSTTSFVQNLPLAQKHFRHYLPLFPKAIESLDLRAYDLILSSSWAVAKGVKKETHQCHICYCHTPIRYAWDLYEEYTASLKQPKKFLVEKTLSAIREWDIATLDRVDYFVANSAFVQERIARTYKRGAALIYPPVDTKKFTLCEVKEDFYLTASRLVPYKKTKLIVEAFNEMPDKKLVVIGSGEEHEAIKAIAAKNISVLGYQEDTVLLEYMQKAQAFVYAAIEDFGIVLVEAMACGTPVVALGVGGTAESVVDGVSGVHFLKQTKESIVKALDRFESITFDYKAISCYAQEFSREKFQKKYKDFVSSKTKAI